MTLLFHRATMAGNTKVETNEGVVTQGQREAACHTIIQN